MSITQYYFRKQVAASRIEAEKDGVHVPQTREEYCVSSRSTRDEGSIDVTDFYDDDDYICDEDEESDCGQLYSDQTDDSGNEES